MESEFIALAAAGKVYQTEPTISYDKGERSGIAAAKFANGCIFYRKFYSRMAIAFISGFSSSPFIQVTNHSDEKASKFLSTYPQQRSLGRCECSSYPSVCNWSRLKQRHWQHFEYVKVNRTCAYHKSEEYDITEAAVDSLKSAEGSIEAVLIEGNLQPCWQQFPKRWVIVLLCFMAFLSCNMDRVNMSIAILPMSQEFNWNSATCISRHLQCEVVQFRDLALNLFLEAFGLIKLVESLLGFGVVWWSIATVLTPIAARIGLPFLLMMRAFMGIGEGVAMPAMNNILSKWIPV
ncbi:ascorbate transporter, chloroplastic-like [Hevea brasiliensis]|uniref:ascorbate transporter, chloroplastic-like n=1 Tax=Hevea brasiliensis TaxID=3981 RepID=UPI0025FEA4AF|nr:ascorbate transporter, chloroplastic-like [Hevea brasiliensis]